MTWRLIIRNIIRNRKNSFVIFLLIAVITFLFFIGNSIIGQANAGLRKTYIDSLTADVIIQKSGDMSMNLFGANSPVIDDYGTIPALPAYEPVMEVLAKENSIESVTSLVSGRVALQTPEISGSNSAALICGVDPETYFTCFPGIVVEQGRVLESGEYGAMITKERADRVEKETGQRPEIGTPLLFSSAGQVSFRIREVPLVGIYRYENPGQYMNEIVIADPQTTRVLLAVQVATAPAADEEPIIFDDDIWNEEFATGSDSEHYDTTVIEDYSDEGFNPDTLIDFLGSTEDTPDEELAGGDWIFILLRLKQGTVSSFFIKTLNQKLEAFNVHAAGWRTGAGISAIMMLLVQSFFNIGGFLVSIAGVIVVVNILLISVFRRTREIGTLRAIGASDSQIRFLVMGENCLLALLSGIAGVLGGALQIGFLPLTAVVSFCIALFLGAAASLYPVETAVHIDPIVAVREG
jgi:ABC-type lipoprotein release transport system permease subunit